MFNAYCPRHGHEVLLSWSRLDHIDNHDGVIDVHLTCWCGEHVVVETGRGALAV